MYRQPIIHKSEIEYVKIEKNKTKYYKLEFNVSINHLIIVETYQLT